MSTLGNFVWSIADQLRGVYKPHQYGDVILPMTILRRLDCVLEPTRDQVRRIAEAESREELRDVKIKRATGLGFYNTSPWDFARLVGDPDGLAANLTDHIAAFSKNIDVFERFRFDNQIATLSEKNRLLIVVQKFAEQKSGGRPRPPVHARRSLHSGLSQRLLIKSARDARTFSSPVSCVVRFGIAQLLWPSSLGGALLRCLSAGRRHLLCNAAAHLSPSRITGARKSRDNCTSAVRWSCDA